MKPRRFKSSQKNIGHYRNGNSFCYCLTPMTSWLMLCCWTQKVTPYQNFHQSCWEFGCWGMALWSIWKWPSIQFLIRLPHTQKAKRFIDMNTKAWDQACTKFILRSNSSLGLWIRVNIVLWPHKLFLSWHGASPDVLLQKHWKISHLIPDT